MSLIRCNVASRCSRKAGSEQISRNARCMGTLSARTLAVEVIVKRLTWSYCRMKSARVMIWDLCEYNVILGVEDNMTCLSSFMQWDFGEGVPLFIIVD